MQETESKEFASILSSHLRQMTQVALSEYIQSNYLTDNTEGISADIVYAVEVDGADFSRGWMSSVPIRSWEICGNDCKTIPFVDMRPFNAASDAGNLWPHPIIAYCAKLPFILSREGVGLFHQQNGAIRHSFSTD